LRASRKAATERYPYGFERPEDIAGIGVALMIWASAVVAGVESVSKLVRPISVLNCLFRLFAP
jgi:divalent metal cation (Fe/Co/Zn/Cd) transporter